MRQMILKPLHNLPRSFANFDWVSYQEAAETVDEKKYKEFEKLVHDNFVDTKHRCNSWYSYTHD